MHSVQKIFPVEKIPSKQKEIIEALEDALKKAHRGELEGVAILMLYTDDMHSYNASSLNTITALGALTRIMYKLQRSGEDDG